MSVIIDMDMPKSCDDCPLCTYYGNGFDDCRLTGIEMNRNAAKVRHPDCPLQEIKKVVIPENPTNGDVIKTLFPTIKTKEYRTFIKIIDGEEYCSINYRWWNSPYKAERINEE